VRTTTATEAATTAAMEAATTVATTAVAAAAMTTAAVGIGEVYRAYDHEECCYQSCEGFKSVCHDVPPVSRAEATRGLSPEIGVLI
jgi:hypothetical protein